jgi:hypothetical protein
MNRNNILGILLATAIFAVPIGITVYRGNVAPPLSPIFTPVEGPAIDGVNTAVVGELVRLTVDGEKVKWTCLPPVNDLETYGASNEKCVVSFRQNGEYTVVAAVVKDSELSLETHKIAVGGVAFTPNPTNPTVPTPGAVTLDSDLVNRVRSWCIEYKVEKAQAAKLASNFQQVAGEIQVGSIKTTGEIIGKTANLNSAISLSGFDGVLARIQSYLTQQADSGQLVTPEQHAKVWFSIASGLNSYATEAAGSQGGKRK